MEYYSVLKKEILTHAITWMNFEDIMHKPDTHKNKYCFFPGGAVNKNPPVNAGNTGLGPEGSHMPWSN